MKSSNGSIPRRSNLSTQVQPAGPWRRRVIVRAISAGRRRDSPSDPRRVYDVLPPLPEDDADEHEHRRQVHQEDPEDRAAGRSKLLKGIVQELVHIFSKHISKR